jgi:hypothetical protein
MSEELYQLEDEVQHLKEAPRAMTVTGRDGKIIAIIHGEETGEVKPGMIVLFSSPPEKAGLEVALIEYQIRQSKTSGKQYVKCFHWIQADAVQKMIQELEKKLEELRKIEREKELQQLRKQNLQALSRLGLGEEALKLIETRQYEAFALLLIKGGAKAVLWNEYYGLFLIISEKSIKITLNNEKIEVEECTLPLRFEPEKWLTSEDKEIVRVDLEIPNAVASQYHESFILVSKGVAEKLKKIMDSRLDEETKKMLYQKLLGEKQ